MSLASAKLLIVFSVTKPCQQLNLGEIKQSETTYSDSFHCTEQATAYIRATVMYTDRYVQCTEAAASTDEYTVLNKNARRDKVSQTKPINMMNTQ